MNDPVTWKMVGQRTTGRLVPGEGRHRDRLVGLRRSLACGFLQVLEAEFKLLDPGAAFRGGPEPLAPKPGDLQLQPLDLDAQGQPSRGFRRLGRDTRLALRQDHRVSGSKVRGKRFRRVRHLPR